MNTSPELKPLVTFYTIFNSPLDYPGEFVVRRFHVMPGGKQAVDMDLWARGPTLESVIEQIPDGLTRIGRHALDVLSLVETWS
ncbi:hypothetical protein Plim_4287 (plasmid) [Planctopirus limnophila DSM 3776]|uniref:Uncharacterized protein n=1 Tax=Planctopirus limnophila (strain ATCC 43296 / DSM 3776 / IFAM 1008 / Mu 290) TaxID=521674 RepID=D5SZH4_PLAL2|nr:hypothetical protein Plim_4287 [Planctopirus limnophila DSM 3776]